MHKFPGSQPHSMRSRFWTFLHTHSLRYRAIAVINKDRRPGHLRRRPKIQASPHITLKVEWMWWDLGFGIPRC